MSIYKIKLITPKGIEEFNCPSDEHILDAAEDSESQELFGKGKWIITDIDRHAFENAIIWLMNRVSNLDPGGVPGDRELWNTGRTVTLEWVKEDDSRNSIYRPSEHTYGETRVIEQTYNPKLRADGSFKMKWEPDLIEELD